MRKHEIGQPCSPQCSYSIVWPCHKCGRRQMGLSSNRIIWNAKAKRYENDLPIPTWNGIPMWIGNGAELVR
jgi:hypothetical protein